PGAECPACALIQLIPLLPLLCQAPPVGHNPSLRTARSPLRTSWQSMVELRAQAVPLAVERGPFPTELTAYTVTVSLVQAGTVLVTVVFVVDEGLALPTATRYRVGLGLPLGTVAAFHLMVSCPLPPVIARFVTARGADQVLTRAAPLAGPVLPDR